MSALTPMRQGGVYLVPSTTVLTYPLDPRIEAAARAIYTADQQDGDEQCWDTDTDAIRDTYVRLAKAAADALGGGTVSGWGYYRTKPVVIEARQLVGTNAEIHADAADKAAEPEDPRVELLAEELEAASGCCFDSWPCSEADRWYRDARLILARLDAVRADA